MQLDDERNDDALAKIGFAKVEEDEKRNLVSKDSCAELEA
jgi:hypothetical protein